MGWVDVNAASQEERSAKSGGARGGTTISRGMSDKSVMIIAGVALLVAFLYFKKGR